MKKLFFTALLFTLFSCQKEEENFQLTETQSVVSTVPNLHCSHNNFGVSTMDTMEVYPFVLNVVNSGAPTTDRCSLMIQKIIPLGYIHFSEFDNNVGGVPVDNVNWRVTEQGTRYLFVSEPGYVITENSKIGLSVMTSTYFGGFSITSTVKSSTGGGETPNSDNITVTSYIVQ